MNDAAIAAVASQAAFFPCGPIRGPKKRMATKEASGRSQASPSVTGSDARPSAAAIGNRTSMAGNVGMMRGNQGRASAFRTD
jgi:hypothetical protein